jgi:hypothetical protein
MLLGSPDRALRGAGSKSWPNAIDARLIQVNARRRWLKYSRSKQSQR